MFYWDPRPEIFIIPGLNIPILWYGLLFAFGFVVAFPLFSSALVRFWAFSSVEPRESLQTKARLLTDRLLIYIVLATIIGARLGHFLFYETPSSYWKDPLEILQIWKGGLASHGAIIAILIAVLLFCRKYRRSPPFLSMLDLLSLPAAWVSGCIRIGNFFNQEILGTPTNLPWGVIFGHPADGSLPVARHPAQLYESFFYFLLFFLLFFLSRTSLLKKPGRLSGLLLTLVFSFRFCIEFLKEEQSHLLGSGWEWTMGQFLSLPLIGLGLFFLCRKGKI